MKREERVCKYYSHGVCISPKLRKPTDAVTSTARCLQGNYIGCRFYDGDDKKKEGLELFIGFTVGLKGRDGGEKKSGDCSNDNNGRDGNSNRDDNSNDNVMMSECEYFEKAKTRDGKTFMRCKVLNRVLPISTAQLCVSHFTSCPFRGVYHRG